MKKDDSRGLIKGRCDRCGLYFKNQINFFDHKCDPDGIERVKITGTKGW